MLEIERHNREIKLLKEKLDFKHKIQTMRVLPPPRNDMNEIQWERVDV